VAWEADHYSAYEAASILGVSPARVRQMLRSGELDGERGPGVAEGVPGPWRVSAGVLEAYRRGERPGERRGDDRPDAETPGDAAETVAMQEEDPGTYAADEATARPPEGGAADTPSETSERLSEGVGALRAKAEELLAELERLEGRLEAAEVQEIALREAARQERERADGLRAELEAGQRGGDGERRGRWRGLFGG
jgi:hypothetical protein